MGVEQVTPEVVFSTDVPPNIDLPDLRLPRAFRVWKDFSLRHESQIAVLGTQPLERVVFLGNELSSSVSQALGVAAATHPRQISEEKMRLLLGAVSGEGNRVVFMRHGEQSPPEWVSSIPDPGLRKIRMMQSPFNRTDLLTNTGLLDAFATALGLLYVQQASGKEVSLLSSENMRAQEVAKIVSTVTGSSFSTLEGLSCITYQDEESVPAMTTDELLDYLPSGTIPWDPNLVDRLCKRTGSGLRQSELIINTVTDLVGNFTEKAGGSNLQIVLTHTQQLAEVLRQRSNLQDPMIRFPELTMLALEESGARILPWGILAEKEK